MQTIVNKVRGWPFFRLAVLSAAYTSGLALSLVLAYLARFDFVLPPETSQHLWLVCLAIIPVKLAFLWIFRQFAGLLSYFSTPDLNRLFVALFCGSAVIGVVRLMGWWSVAPPRGVILADFILSFLLLASIRLGFRITRERFLTPLSAGRSRARVQ